MPNAFQGHKNQVIVSAGIRVGKLQTVSGTVTTTDATVTTLATFTPADATAGTVFGIITGRKSDGAEVGGYVVIGTFRRAGSTTTQVSTTTAPATHEDTAAWAATIDASGTDVRVRVTGAASSTIAWTCTLLINVAP